MTDISLDETFIPDSAANEAVDTPDALERLLALHPVAAHESIRRYARRQSLSGDFSVAIDVVGALQAQAENIAEPDTSNLRIALLQTLAALHIASGHDNDALSTAAAALTLLAQEPRRKDEFFLAALASLLYDIATLHSTSGYFKQAEREIEKSMKLFERLAKTQPQKYGSAHIMAMNASTQIYRSVKKQAEMLEQTQAATNSYLQLLDQGISEASLRLIDSLAQQGRTLSKMTRYREAVQYFTKALKNLTKLDSGFTVRHLELSIDLGEALLHNKATRDKGIHLLNTMLHKSLKLNAEEQHRHIVDVLIDIKKPHLEIFAFWHKIFPR